MKPLVLAIASLLLATATVAQPYLEYVQVDEVRDLVSIHGRFDGATASVRVENTPLAIVERSDSLLLATIPLIGPGAHGRVVVRDQHGESNAHRLSAWWIGLREHYEYSTAGPWDERYTVNWKLHLRADLDAYQLTLDPGRRVIRMMASKSSRGDIDYHHQEYAFTFWDGGGSITWSNGLRVSVTLDAHTGSIGLSGLTVTGKAWKTRWDTSQAAEWKPLYHSWGNAGFTLDSTHRFVQGSADLNTYNNQRLTHTRQWWQDSAASLPPPGIAFLDSLRVARAVYERRFDSLPYSRFDRFVRAMILFKGDLIVGGDFRSISGTSVSRVARLTRGSWSSMGEGFDNVVNALAVYNGELYAAGTFDSASHKRAHSVARWDGSDWVEAGEGLNGPVKDLFVTSTGLVAVGSFDAPARSIARLTPAGQWEPLGDPAMHPQGEANCVVEIDRTLYVGGTFRTCAGKPSTCIARFDMISEEWLPMGSLFAENSAIHTMAASGARLFVGGRFDSVGRKRANNLAEYTDGTWRTLGLGVHTDNTLLYPQARVYSVIVRNDTLYAGGEFRQLGSPRDTANSFAAYAIQARNWVSFGRGVRRIDTHLGEMPGKVYRLHDTGSGILIGGEFTWTGDKEVGNIAGLDRTVMLSTPRTNTIDDNLAVYPNPAAHVVRLPIALANEPIRIIDAMGRDRMQTQLDHNAQLNVRELPVGHYLILTGSGRSVGFVKSR